RKIGLKTIEPLPRNKWLSFKSVCRTITGQNKVLLESYISHDPSKNEWIKMVSTTFGTNESFTPEHDYDQALVDSCIGQGDKTVDNLNNHFFAGPATSIMIRLDKCKNIKIKSFSIREIAPIGTTPTPGFEDPNLAPLLASEVTPTYLFYRIDINPIVPQVDSKTWNLTIKGLVEKPFTINYDQIKSMPSVEEYVTLECISNKIGGDLISTALWKGVRLSQLLEKAVIKPNVKYVVFRCADGYDVGIPIEKSQMEGTILAYDMNYAALTPKHGFPVRAIVPGLYGMMNPKWLTEIELVDSVYKGYWQRLGWRNNAEDNTGSSILIPGEAPARQRFRKLDETEDTSYGGKVPIAGIAFAGNRGISKVEVSTDGGTTWKTAQIKDPLSQYTWVLWTAGYVPPNKENYKIVVRATDKTGKVQTTEMSPPFPNGASGYHTITA
ncbi:MAG: molybdopterin-dependent oxidoreductase, partial [Nitrososphaeraceae archaeon]